MNLHDREESVALVKVALEKDKGRQILSKGDLPGHDFHGNQWTVGSVGAEVERQQKFVDSLKAQKDVNPTFMRNAQARLTALSQKYMELKMKEKPQEAQPSPHTSPHTPYDPRARFMSTPGEQAKQRRISQSAFPSSFGGDASNYTR
jgi:hypothetical protein